MKFLRGHKKSSSCFPSIPSDNNNSEQLNKITPFSRKVLFILSAIATLVMYAETMISISIPEIIKEFSISFTTLLTHDYKKALT